MISRCEFCGKTFSDTGLKSACEAQCREQVLSRSPTPKKPKPTPPDFDIQKVAKEIMKSHENTLKKLAIVEQEENKAKKFDNGKPDLSILPVPALKLMSAAFTYGAGKYGRNNYKNGLEVTRTLSAALRHIYAFLDGENNDPESGVNHLGHALASVAMTVYNLEKNPSKDDR